MKASLPKKVDSMRYISSYFKLVIVCISICFIGQAHSRDMSNEKDPQEFINEAEQIKHSDIDRAYELLNTAVRLAHENEEIDIEVDVYLRQARLAKTQKEYFLAQQYLRQAEQGLVRVKSERLKVETLYLYAEILRMIKHYDEALEYSARALEIAKQLNEAKLLFKCITIQGNVYRSSKRYNDALASYLVGQDYLVSLSDKEKVSLYDNIASTYNKLKQFKQAARFYQKSIIILEKTKNVKKLPKTLLSFAQAQKNSGNYGMSLASTKRAYTVSKENDNEYFLLKSLIRLSVLYRRLGSYELALDHGLEALSIYERNEDLNGIASAANSIGLLYVHLEQFDNAENYFNQVLSIPKENVLVKYHGASLRELSLLLMRRGEHEKAITLSEDAFDIFEKLTDLNGMLTVKRILGQIYQKMGNVPAAKQAFISSLSMAEKKKRKWDQAVNLAHLADLLAGIETKQAKEYGLQSLVIAEEVEAKSVVEQAYASLIKIEKLNKNYKQALEYAELKEVLVSEMKTKAINKRVAELHVVLDIEKKERELINYKRQQTILSLELDRKQKEIDLIAKDDAIDALRSKNTYFVIGSIFLFSVLSFILILKLRRQDG